jgi:hypothetical protein
MYWDEFITVVLLPKASKASCTVKKKAMPEDIATKLR